jgi:hypothetical protein
VEFEGEGGGGCWPAWGGRGGGTAVYKLQKEGFNYDTDPLEFLVCVEFHSEAVSASECSSS